jgi:hypothetical protein
MWWVDMLGADGVTVVGVLLVGVIGITFFYVRLLNRYLQSMEEENKSLHEAILRRDEDERVAARELTTKLAENGVKLDVIVAHLGRNDHH